MKTPGPATVYQLKVTLAGVRPPVWRRLLVPSTVPLPRLHDILQAAFGWQNYHIHQFVKGRDRYGIPSPDYDDGDTHDERRVPLDVLLAKPKDKLVYEYDFGDGWEHVVVLEKVEVAARATSTLIADLNLPFRRGRGGPGGWVFLVEPELHLGPRPDKLVPDLAGWHRGRLPDALLESDAEGAITIAPDWVCEVLSARTERIDRGKKRRIYRWEGIGHLWYVDPRYHSLEVYRLEGGRWLEVDTFEGDGPVRAEPFEVIELVLGDLWRW